jgi:hypothetical protein
MEKMMGALGGTTSEGEDFLYLLMRLTSAAILGTLLAYRPWRRALPHMHMVRVETAQAQLLICVSAAMVIAVIGDNMARAFGLVGLGGFIRFRSGIKDPRDAAVMFVLIGVGMACGLGLVPIALVGTVFVGACLAFLDATSSRQPRILRVGVVADDGRALLPLVQQAWPHARILTVPNTVERGKIVLEMDVAEGVDAASVIATLQKAGAQGIREVWMDDD